MGLYVLLLLFVALSLTQSIGVMLSEYRCSTCNLTCNEQNSLQICEGPSGQAGSMGRKGIRGDVGLPGISCDCDHYTDLRKKLEDLRKDMAAYRERSKLDSFEWQNASNGMWYRLYEDRSSFEEAKQNCLSNNARMWSTGIRNDKMRREVLRTIPRPIGALWAGYNDIATEGTWVWSDGHTDISRRNKLWRNSPWEPNNVGGNEDCAHMYVISHETGKIVMNDVPCYVPTHYVCEYEP